MDRIYYFRLTKDNRKKEESNILCQSAEQPVFFREAGGYEVYYLQVGEETEGNELAKVQAYMKKGISRLAACYQREQDRMNAYLVYDGSFARWLQERRQEEHWQQLWNLPLYGEYKEPHNLQVLLQQISKSRWPRHLVILGEAPCMEKWLEPMAKYMKSIVQFSLNRSKGFDTIREKLLDEYGLLIKWEKSLQPQSEESAMVLDYCGKENVFIWGIPPGSVWVDMTSRESRRHAIEDRETGIYYTSLKTFWQGEMLQTLDTINKIKYNTKVKLQGEMGVIANTSHQIM